MHWELHVAPAIAQTISGVKKSIHHFPARNPDSPISPSPDFPYFPMVFGFISGCLRLHVHLVGFLSIFLLSI